MILSNVQRRKKPNYLPIMTGDCGENSTAATFGFEKNVRGLVEVTAQAARNGVKLIVLPEVATTGFIYANPAALEPNLDTIPGKTTAALEPIARQYNAYIVVGLYEKDRVTGLTHNAAVLIGPKGVLGKYRKNQLPPGDFILASPCNLGFPVFETEIGKIALLICFDDTRLQNILLPNLRGADILAMPMIEEWRSGMALRSTLRLIRLWPII